MVSNPLEQAIFQALFLTTGQLFEFSIQEGFYNPTQMVTELQNKFVHSGVGAYASLVLHERCGCSKITEEDFAEKISEWMLEGFDPKSVR